MEQCCIEGQDLGAACEEVSKLAFPSQSCLSRDRTLGGPKPATMIITAVIPQWHSSEAECTVAYDWRDFLATPAIELQNFPDFEGTALQRLGYAITHGHDILLSQAVALALVTS